MIWKPDLAAELRRRYPQWMDFFKKNRADSGETPSIQFTKRDEVGHFDLGFEGTAPAEASTGFEVPIKSGDTIDNDTLRAIFHCSVQGAMRRSLQTNSLVLISDHTKSAYEDKWIGKTFHYTGMGHIGEQSLSLHQNKTLAESRETGVRLFLFEVFSEGKYMYVGEVELAESPYRSRQPDCENTLRDVWIFPLKLRGRKQPPLIRKEIIATKEETVRRLAKKMPLDELEFQARYALKEGGRREVVSEVYEHDQLVSEYAKRKANGTCQLCDQPAPFPDRNGEPYLEIHHIVARADGGQDVIGNVVALCPNCHRRMHELQREADLAKLRSIAADRR
jgi:5-methylcytosine-specific restriction protein A